MLNDTTAPRRDTEVWTLQVWGSFVASVILCTGGIMNVDASHVERMLLILGYLFCLFTAFTLSKSVRDNQRVAVDTEAWRWQVRVGFVAAIGLTAWGILSLNLNLWQRGFLGASWLYMEAAAFTLAKLLRDAQDVERWNAQNGRGMVPDHEDL